MGQLNQERKPMFPLFEKPSKAISSEEKAPTSFEHTVNLKPIAEDVSKKTAQRGSKKPKKATKDDPKPPSTSNFPMVIPSANASELLGRGPNEGRRKRQRTVSPKDKASESREDVQPTSPAIDREARRRKASSSNKRQVAIEFETSMEEHMADDGLNRLLQPKEIPSPENSPSGLTEGEENGMYKGPGSPGREKVSTLPALSVIQESSRSKEHMTNKPPDKKPQKVLHFNPKTGTIGSPPAKKTTVPPSHAKPKSSSRAKQPKIKLVIIHYGHARASAAAIGLQINQILAGSKLISPVTTEKSPAKAKQTQTEASKSAKRITNVAAKSPAALHPFFSGKPVAKPKDATKPETVAVAVPERLGSVSIDQPRTKTGNKPPAPSKSNTSAFTGFQGFGTSSKLVKFPGAIEPAWPWKGMVHIRGDEDTVVQQKPPNESVQIYSKVKKSKYQAVQILASEDVIRTALTDLCISQMLTDNKNIHQDEYPQLSPCLRIPTKHFESGYNLQNRVRKELRSRFLPSKLTDVESSSEEEIQSHNPPCERVHPALSKAYASIPMSLSAFDQFQCETQPWTHKYSPKTAVEVLQIGKEAVILKEWLQKLTVMSVETGPSDRPDSRASSVSRKSDPSGKRKRKSKKLDGFVVSSDEEDNDLDEISEPEDTTSPPGSQGLLRKTLIRANKDALKLGNAVLISGPHGCGKTAAVYAVAKELAFEVFEINSSSRRSGKDILEKVGDMTRNHLVQHSHSQIPAEVLDEDAQRISDALADDIKTGRQGTMNSFFKPQSVAISRPKPTKPKPISKTMEPVQASLAPKAPSKKQKQSLILFEEVDILYEEDKQFWATVITLIAQSKRPIIMTCRNEAVVPMSQLALHGILRFKPAPTDLATDYMLSVAASEGHALQRDAVKSLYQSRQFDLRASLMELNFWCQFAIGDVKGGLDWIYPRWPIGCDVDEYGNTIRVVSEKTYEAGMGWMSQDVLESHAHYLDIEEETLREAWDGWHLDLGDWHKTIGMADWADHAKRLSTEKVDNRACLSIYDDFSDAMSIADMCSGSAFAPDNDILLDVTMPEVSDKLRDDYTLDHQLIEAAPLMNYVNTGSNIAHWMRSRARKYLQVDQHVRHGFEVPLELDRPSEARIISLIRDQISSPEFSLTRRDLSAAFEPISEPEKTILWMSGHVEASVFDRTKTIITKDLAPYVRSIVAYDAKLQEERSRISNLLSEGGKKAKRMRTTRAANAALEGGARSTTRRDKYFGAALNPYLVFKTGMPSWLEAVPAATASISADAGTRLSTENSDLSGMTDVAQDELAEESTR